MRMMAPWLAWALLLSLLPIVIHLLNRLRYKTVPWAAIMFLIQANQSSTRNARLRHWLILASRCMLLFFFIFLFTRPLMGGWFGSVMAGKPKVVLLLLDRSASMEARDPRVQMSKREQAVKLWVKAARELGRESRFVLIEHVLREPQSLQGGPGALENMALAGPTDTAADIPALLRSGLEYLKRNPGDRAEIWVASDLQQSNWHPDSREWSALAAQFDALPQDVNIRVMPLLTTPELNHSISLSTVRRSDAETLLLTPQLRRTEQAAPKFYLRGVLDAREIPEEVEMEGTEYGFAVDFPLDEEKQEGWGLLELPADQNPADNRCFFVYGGEGRASALAVLERDLVGQRLQRAVAPDEKIRFFDQVAFGAESNAAFDKQGLVVWQGGAPSDKVAERLREFVEAGGVILSFPPGDERPGLFGLQWGGVSNAGEEPFRIEKYDDIDGPLANTAGGLALPVDRLGVRQVQEALGDDRWNAIASLDGDVPFLLERIEGQGRVYACTTLPDPAWSDLGGRDGAVVFVLMVQRMLRAGSSRLARVRSATAGEWRPPEGADEIWEPVDTDTFRDHRWQAGVYRSGPKLLALNRPAAEDDRVFLDPAETTGLFGDLPVQVLGQEEMAPDRKVFTEIWRFFLIAALAFLIFEGFLLLQERKVAPA